MTTKNNLTIEQITAINIASIDEVYAAMMLEVNGGSSRFDGVENDAKFSAVPKFKELIAKRNHDLLCFPT